MFLVGLRAFAKAVSYTATTVRVDPALIAAFGLPGCAEQSVIAQTLNAATESAHFNSKIYRQVLLWVVLRGRGGLGLGVLQNWVNLWPSQKARTQRLILDPLRQFLDDPGGRSPGGARLRRIARCLIQRPQCRLDLPLFAWQAEICCEGCRLAQVIDGLLAVPLPHGQHRQRPQVGNAVARVRSEAFPQSLHCCSRLALLSPTQ